VSGNLVLIGPSGCAASLAAPACVWLAADEQVRRQRQAEVVDRWAAFAAGGRKDKAPARQGSPSHRRGLPGSRRQVRRDRAGLPGHRVDPGTRDPLRADVVAVAYTDITA
jgi:hypothetical protein